MKTLNKRKFKCYVCGKNGEIRLLMMVGEPLWSCYEHVSRIVEMDRELAKEEEINFKLL